MKLIVLACACLAFFLTSLSGCNHRHAPDSAKTASIESSSPSPTPIRRGWEPWEFSSTGQIVKVAGPHYANGDIPLKGNWYRTKPDREREMYHAEDTESWIQSDDSIYLRHNGDGAPLREPNSSQPSIVVACNRWPGRRFKGFDPTHEFRVIVFIGAPASGSRTSVHLRYDDRPIVEEDWITTKTDILEPVDPDHFVRDVASAKNLMMQFTPRGEIPQVVKFDLGGSDEVLRDLDAACKRLEGK
jgi:hypothetical protein